MYSRSLYTPSRALVALLLALSIFIPFVYSHPDRHSHEHLHRRFAASGKRRHPPRESSMSVEEARSLVVQAQEAMTVANAAILANPAANVHSHQNASDIREAVAPAAPLNHQSPNATLARRQVSDPALSNSTFSNRARSRNTHSYTIPSELAQAAAVLAEEAPPTINMADYARGRRMQLDLKPRRNNTNAMRQKIRRPDGLNQAVVDDQTEANQFRVTDPEPSASSVPDSGSIASGTKFRREDDRPPPYWIGNHERMGSSPFAPPGYEVSSRWKSRPPTYFP